MIILYEQKTKRIKKRENGRTTIAMPVLFFFLFFLESTDKKEIGIGMNNSYGFE